MLEEIQASKFLDVPITESFHIGGSTSVESKSTNCFDQLLAEA